MLGNVPIDLQGMNEMQKEVWTDVISRSTMAKQLILDTNAGMLDMMVHFRSERCVQQLD